MKRRTRHLKETAVESLTLAVEIFNRPSPVARAQGVMLPLQHAFEMLTKAAVMEDRGRIQDKGEKFSYGLRECLGILRGSGKLTEEQAVVIATVAATRDGVQHHGAAVSEERLYVDCASGLRVFDDLLDQLFGEHLADREGFAQRMLPVSANAPRELHILTGAEVDTIRTLLNPKTHRHAEAQALLRTLVVSDRAAQDPFGEVAQPSDGELELLARRLKKADNWTGLLPGLAKLSLEVDEGHTYQLRVTKASDATPVRVLPDGTEESADVVSILKVDALKTYPFYAKDLKEQLGVNQHEIRALIYLLNVKDDPRCYRQFIVGKQPHQRYSHEALRRLREAHAADRLAEACVAYTQRNQPAQAA